jgi:serine/threonine protein kinase
LKELAIYCKLNLLTETCFLRVCDVNLVTNRLHTIRTSMELANLGDAADYINKENHDISNDLVQSLFAQILFALEIAHEKIGLVHYDLKLLNILVREVLADECIKLKVGEATFTLALKQGDLAAMLNDFGTARTDPVPNETSTADHSTPRGKTAEEAMGVDSLSEFWISFAATPCYVAMEVLYRGDKARLDQTIDCFHLGFCLFHLGAGEDIWYTVDISCPSNLRAALLDFWRASD